MEAGHLWLHLPCWYDWHRARQSQAAAALAQMGIVEPTGGPPHAQVTENERRPEEGRLAAEANLAGVRLRAPRWLPPGEKPEVKERGEKVNEGGHDHVEILSAPPGWQAKGVFAPRPDGAKTGLGPARWFPSGEKIEVRGLLERCQRHGLKIEVAGDRLKLRAPILPPENLLAELREERPV